jgi:hypothetical protein
VTDAATVGVSLTVFVAATAALIAALLGVLGAAYRWSERMRNEISTAIAMHGERLAALDKRLDTHFVLRDAHDAYTHETREAIASIRDRLVRLEVGAAIAR